MVNYTQAREKLHSGKGQQILHLRRRNRETLLGAIASISELRRSLGLATHGAAVRFHICSLTRTPLIANDGKVKHNLCNLLTDSIIRKGLDHWICSKLENGLILLFFRDMDPKLPQTKRDRPSNPEGP